MKNHWLVIGLMFALIACETDSNMPDLPYPIDLPSHFPNFPDQSKNPITQEKVTLGRKLFFDPILSVDSSISCASCHKQSKAFADEQVLSFGVNAQIGMRNSQPLFNLAWNKFFFRDGGVPSLELSALAPISASHEMAFSLPGLVERLNKHPLYKKQFKQAFKRNPDAQAVIQALAAFQRILISANSPFDRYVQGNDQALSTESKRGMNLFFSDTTSCFRCHSGFNFTNQTFDNNGLYLNYADSGRMRITTNAADRALFAVPSLRNLAYTAPYMHNGSIAELADVIEHYNAGGENHPHKSSFVRPLQLSNEQKQALISFLNSLNDETFLINQAFSKPND